MELSPTTVTIINWVVLILWVGTSLLGEISSLRELWDDFWEWLEARKLDSRYRITSLGRLLIAAAFVWAFTFSCAVGISALITRLFYTPPTPDPSLYTAVLQAGLILMLMGFYAAKKLNRIMRAQAERDARMRGYAEGKAQASLEVALDGD